MKVHLEAAVAESAAVIVLVPAEEDVGQAGFAHPGRAQDDDAGTVVPEERDEEGKACATFSNASGRISDSTYSLY